MPRRPAAPHPFRPHVTRYHDRDGRRCAKGTPGAKKITEQIASYYADLPRVGQRPERVALGTDDERQAWRALEAILVERRRQAEGLADPLLAHARKGIGDHVEDWLKEVASKGTSAEQVGTLGSRVRKLIALAGWKRLADITAGTCLEALGKVQQERVRGMPEGRKGRGARTRNHYLAAVRQLVNWSVDNSRLARDPLRSIPSLSVETDQRHARRSPTEAEVGQLMAYLEGPSAAVRCRMTGPQRALGYRVAMATGYRAGELRSITAASFDLDREQVTVRATHSKHRRHDTQPLPPWLVEEVRAWLVAGQPLWSDFPAKWPGRVLMADQEACGVAYAVEGPEGLAYFDFHSLRHWYCTWAAGRPGISPKALLTLARHSDPRLTLQTYAHPVEAEIRGHVAEMPRPGGRLCSDVSTIPGRMAGCSVPAGARVHLWTPGNWPAPWAEEWWPDEGEAQPSGERDVVAG